MEGLRPSNPLDPQKQVPTIDTDFAAIDDPKMKCLALVQLAVNSLTVIEQTSCSSLKMFVLEGYYFRTKAELSANRVLYPNVSVLLFKFP